MIKTNVLNINIFTKGSLKQWTLASFFIVTLPLIFAIIYAIYKVTDYTEQSQSTLFQAVHETESSRIILERLVSMERNIRQYQILREPGFYNAYRENRKYFLYVMEALKLKDMPPYLVHQLSILKKNEHSLNEHILQKINNEQIIFTQEYLNVFDQLTGQARLLLADGEERVRLEAESMAKTAKSVKQKLIYLALISITFALFLALQFVHFLSKPISDIAWAIRQLGNDGFDKPIAIRGPDDLQKLGSQLEWLRIRLNHLEHEQQQFMKNISHELKTPLATLKEGTDLLSENVVGELNKEQHEIIQLMKISNININNLVENLLEYQSSISTQINFNLSIFKLETLIERVSDEYQLLLRSKNIHLDLHLQSTRINADYDKLKTIISNLLSNALKFSPLDASIGLNLSSYNNIVTFIIEDQGSGIPENIQPMIFEDFFHSKASLNWNVKNSGLGLALVKYYLGAHKGSINLLPATKKYCGARFLLELPQSLGDTE